MKKNRILILGKGYFGKRLQEGLGCELSGRRINYFKDIEEEIKMYRPKVLINCIGHIGRNVDECEKNIDKTLQANSFVPLILLEAALRNKIKLVHLSTGCIFNFDYRRNKPITERQIPDFFELFYSRSKIYPERALEALSREFNILIVRPRVPLDDRPDPKNLLNKLLRFNRVINRPNSVTYMPDFVKAVKHLIDIDAKGVFNVTNKGRLRYSQLLDAYAKYVPGFKYQLIEPAQLKLVRTNLVLSTKKLEETGFKVRDINQILEECVKNYLKY